MILYKLWKLINKYLNIKKNYYLVIENSKKQNIIFTFNNIISILIYFKLFSFIYYQLLKIKIIYKKKFIFI
jgi:hypothetical protein